MRSTGSLSPRAEARVKPPLLLLFRGTPGGVAV